MSTRTALWICGAALAVGLAGDHLLRGVPWGAGTALWLLLAIGAALAVAFASGRLDGTHVSALLVTAALFAMGLVWRDADELKAWNVLAILGLLTLGLLRLRGVALRLAGVLDYVTETVTAGFRLLVGPLALATVGVTDRVAPQPRGRRAARAVVVGVLVKIGRAHV